MFFKMKVVPTHIVSRFFRSSLRRAFGTYWILGSFWLDKSLNTELILNSLTQKYLTAKGLSRCIFNLYLIRIILSPILYATTNNELLPLWAFLIMSIKNYKSHCWALPIWKALAKSGTIQYFTFVMWTAPLLRQTLYYLVSNKRSYILKAINCRFV